MCGCREVVQTMEELQALDLETTEYLVGLFSEGHFAYHLDDVNDPPDPPTPRLADLVEIAINQLQVNNSDGFFLMVEGLAFVI